MSTYKTKREIIAVNGLSLTIVSLADRRQFYDPDKTAELLGISDSMWPISGLVWPSGIVLARVVNRLDLASLRILEVGCGIALASLVAASKQANITASDYHPIVNTFLCENAQHNNLQPIKYFHGNWHHPISNHGKFDLIIGSDILYESEYCEILSVYMQCHLTKGGQIILIDPGRRKAGKIKKFMGKLGFECKTTRLDEQGDAKKKGIFTQYNFQRV